MKNIVDEFEDISNELLIIPKSVIDLFLKEKNSGDLIALYNFYYYTAKWQRTNQPRCTDNYCMKGLHYGIKRFRKAKRKLLDLKLITQITRRDVSGRITGLYIKINYIFKKDTIKKKILGAFNVK